MGRIKKDKNSDFSRLWKGFFPMFLKFTPVFAAMVAVLASIPAQSIPAQAEPKWSYWAWPESHWVDQTFKPYLEHPMHPHNTQWDRVAWNPADWSAQSENGTAGILRGFYTAEIFVRQYMDGEMPVLVVGPNFYHLSGQDKRRAVRMVDEYYQITKARENGMFLIEDWRSRKPIGTYTAHGLQLQ
jgi:hypothetical protein